MAATKTAPKMFATANDLPQDSREKVVELLNQHLANSLDLYSQTKQAHWNIRGHHFYQLHLLFDELAAHVIEWIDEIAERATALGGYATGTVRMSASNSQLDEYPTDATTGEEHVRALVERWSTYGKGVREAIDFSEQCEDADTADLFTEISRAVDKDLWFIEAHQQK